MRLMVISVGAILPLVFTVQGNTYTSLDQSIEPDHEAWGAPDPQSKGARRTAHIAMTMKKNGCTKTTGEFAAAMYHAICQSQ